MSDKIFPKDFNWQSGFPHLRRKLRLCIVGGGRISHTQAMAARQTGYWEVVAGALSSDPTKAIKRGEEWYFKADRSYSDFKEMARTEASRPDGVDAVVITAPNHVHFDASKTFLEAGIDVLCDKPLTNELGEAEQLRDIRNKTDRVFGVCYVMSCFAMIRQAREIVANGTIGNINQIHVEFMQDWMMPKDIANADHVKWRLDPAKSGKTSCVGDIGTHAAHLASFVTGLRMTKLRAEFHVCGAPKPLEDTAFMMTRYEGDVLGTLMVTRLASGNRGGLRLRVFGDKGGVEWDLEKSEQLKLNIYGKPDQIITRGHGHGISPSVERLVRTGRGFPEGLIEAWANLYTEFAIAVAAKQDDIDIPPNTLIYPKLDEGVEAVRFVEAAVQSAQSGGVWMSI